MQKYVLLEDEDDYYYSLDEFLTGITTWRELINTIKHCKYADSIRNFAEPVTGNLGGIPYSITHKDFNLMLWRFKYHITKNKTVKKSHGLIKFMRYVHMHILHAIYCTPLHAAAILCVFAEIYSTEEEKSH